MRKKRIRKSLAVLLCSIMVFSSCEKNTTKENGDNPQNGVIENTEEGNGQNKPDTEKNADGNNQDNINDKTGEKTDDKNGNNENDAGSKEKEGDAGNGTSDNPSGNNSEDVPEGDTNETSEEKTAGPEVLKFSKSSGVYEAEFQLEISSDDTQYNEIFYTLDGSDPAVSSTAVKYEGGVLIKDRSAEKNVVSAVDPTLFSANYCKVNDTKDGFECKIKAPSDEAVDKCTTIRAVAKNSDGEISREENAVFFFGTMEEHIQGLAESCEASGQPLAVISLSMDFDDLFDNEKGIYVKGAVYDKAAAQYFKNNKRPNPEDARKMDANYREKGRSWEREAGMTFLEVSGDGKVSEVLSHNCGVRIQGNYSRSDLQKGLRIYARKDYGPKNFKYAVFGEDYLNDAGEVMKKFKTLTLRAGGNTAFSAKFNDTYWQSMLYDFSVDTQRSRPCVLYINGEYFGLYILQEDYSDDYFEELHGVEKDDVVVYKGDAEALALGYKLDEGSLPAGERDESYYFKELLDFFKKHKNLKSEADYQEFCKLVDPQSVLEYFAVEVWIDNKWDWPGKNWSMWKTITDNGTEYGDGRWRFMLYDIEFGGFGGSGDATHNTVKEDNYKPKGLLDMGTDNPAVLCFAYLMTNEGFKNAFCDMLDYLSENTFSYENAGARLDWFSEVYSPLYEQFFERYSGAGKVKDAEGSIGNIRAFLKVRGSNI